MSAEDFTTRARQHIEANTPHLLELFDVMAGEARFARAWLDKDLRRLSAAAPVLEVGGGVFLLACQLAREGYSVTAIEPTGVGFGAFEELGVIVMTLAGQDGRVPEIVRCGVEDFVSDRRYAMAFSVNVMEHVAEPDRAIARISSVLERGASYQFLCPNYLFPYEPHFNIPTFGSKALTEKLMRKRIEECVAVSDPAGVWKSLNWITVSRVRRIARSDASLDAKFRTSTLAWMLERALSDSEFARRRSVWMVTAIRALRSLGLLRLTALIPAALHPIMDVRLTKRA